MRHRKPRPPVALIALSVIVGVLSAFTIAAAVVLIGTPAVEHEAPVSAPVVSAPAVTAPAVVVEKPAAAVEAPHSVALSPAHPVAHKPVVKHVKHAAKKHKAKAKRHHHGHKKHHHKRHHHSRCR